MLDPDVVLEGSTVPHRFDLRRWLDVLRLVDPGYEPAGPEPDMHLLSRCLDLYRGALREQFYIAVGKAVAGGLVEEALDLVTSETERLAHRS